jgi:hypothetical protein
VPASDRGAGIRRQVDVGPELSLEDLRGIKGRDYVVRFAFGAVISVVAALVAQATSPRFGGVFLAFPAILPASLTLIQEKEGTRDADRDAVGAVLGGLGLSVFGVVAEGLFGRIPSPLVLVVALAGWTVAALGLYALLALFRPDDCDKNQD